MIYLAKDYITFSILCKGYRTYPQIGNEVRTQNQSLSPLEAF